MPIKLENYFWCSEHCSKTNFAIEEIIECSRQCENPIKWNWFTSKFTFNYEIQSLCMQFDWKEFVFLCAQLPRLSVTLLVFHWQHTLLVYCLPYKSTFIHLLEQVQSADSMILPRKLHFMIKWSNQFTLFEFFFNFKFVLLRSKS